LGTLAGYWRTRATGSHDGVMSNGESSARIASTAADLAAVTDTVERLRARVGALAEPFLGTDHEDIVAVIYESERLLLAAERALHRASRTLDR